jgi:cytochrome c1
MNGRACPTIRRAAAAVLALLACAACTQARVDERQAMQLTHGGRAELGPRWAEQYGCGGCHLIPGVPGARGRVGPPLDNVAVRLFVGGGQNHPDDLVAWIQDPQRVDSATAMPKTGVTERQARDIAAYLYTLAH